MATSFSFEAKNKSLAFHFDGALDEPRDGRFNVAVNGRCGLKIDGVGLTHDAVPECMS